MEKEKYEETPQADMFESLIMELTELSNPEDYIAMQDQLFKNLSDKSSYEAESILKRKIDFYKRNGDEETTQRIREENIQIESFRQEVVKKRIAENKLQEAKSLINEYIQDKSKEHSSHRLDSLAYLTKYLRIECVSEYYKYTALEFPEKLNKQLTNT